MKSRVLPAAVALVLTSAVSGAAQTPAPPSPQPPAADTPAIKVGVLLFADYAVQQEPKAHDADNNTVTFNQFEITRSYINVTGNLSKTIAFRVTPDIVRETGVGSSLNGSYTFRLKFAYAQWNLDDHLGAGSWVRFGLQQNPWVDFIDTIYRYRFQGQSFEDREGFLPSADTGATFHYNLPGNYGDLHAGFYNGETYQHAELNDQKAFQIRGTVRPAPGGGALQGLRLTGFYDHDAYVRHAERRRAIVGVTFEHRYLNAAFNYLTATDQTLASATKVDARGWSAFVTPKTNRGWEGLLRIDHLEPNTAVSDQKKQRTIAGVAYWFPHQGSVSSAVLFDVDNTTFTNFSPTRPTDRRIAVHTMISF